MGRPALSLPESLSATWVRDEATMQDVFTVGWYGAMRVWVDGTASPEAHQRAAADAASAVEEHLLQMLSHRLEAERRETNDKIAQLAVDLAKSQAREETLSAALDRIAGANHG